MNRKRMIYIGTIALFALAGVFAWNMMARAAYRRFLERHFSPNSFSYLAASWPMDSSDNSANFTFVSGLIVGLLVAEHRCVAWWRGRLFRCDSLLLDHLVRVSPNRFDDLGAEKSNNLEVRETRES